MENPKATYWLKGGIIGIFFSLLGILLFYLGDIGIIPLSQYSQSSWTSIIILIPSFVFIYPFTILFGRPEFAIFFISKTMFVTVPLVYFLLGAIIGFILQKLKISDHKIKRGLVIASIIILMTILILTINSFAIRNSENKDSTFFNEGIKNLDSFFCNQIKMDWQRNECLRRVAIGKGDITYCRNMPESYQKWHCYQEVAFILNDFSICGEVGRYEQDCLDRRI